MNLNLKCIWNKRFCLSNKDSQIEVLNFMHDNSLKWLVLWFLVSLNLDTWFNSLPKLSMPFLFSTIHLLCFFTQNLKNKYWYPTARFWELITLLGSLCSAEQLHPVSCKLKRQKKIYEASILRLQKKYWYLFFCLYNAYKTTFCC